MIELSGPSSWMYAYYLSLTETNQLDADTIIMLKSIIPQDCIRECWAGSSPFRIWSDLISPQETPGIAHEFFAQLMSKIQHDDSLWYHSHHSNPSSRLERQIYSIFRVSV